jgi:hypothetical protein
MLITETRPKGHATPVADTRFARPTLLQYSTMILEQAGIESLAKLSHAFLGDPGRDVPISQRQAGGGYEFTQHGTLQNERFRGAWLVFEKHSDDTIRARAFQTLEGASAEFSTRLVLHDKGDVSMRELSGQPEQHRGRNIQITFEGSDPGGVSAMVLAPIGVALDTASRLFSA